MGGMFSKFIEIRGTKRLIRRFSRRQFCSELTCKIIKAKDIVWIARILKDCTEIGKRRSELALALGLLPAEVEETIALVNLERSGIHGFLLSTMNKWIAGVNPEIHNVSTFTTVLRSCKFNDVAGKVIEVVRDAEGSPFLDRPCRCNKPTTSAPVNACGNYRHLRVPGEQVQNSAASSDDTEIDIEEVVPLAGQPGDTPIGAIGADSGTKKKTSRRPCRLYISIFLGLLFTAIFFVLVFNPFTPGDPVSNGSTFPPRGPLRDNIVDIDFGNTFHNMSTFHENCTETGDCRSNSNSSHIRVESNRNLTTNTPARKSEEPTAVCADQTSLASWDCKSISNLEYTILPTDAPQQFFGTCDRESVHDLALKGGFTYAQFYQIVSTNLQYSLDSLNLTDPYICQSFTRPRTCNTRYEFESLKKIIFWKNVSECTELFLHLAECGNYHKFYDIILDQPPRTRAAIRGLEELKRAGRGKILILYTRS